MNLLTTNPVETYDNLKEKFTNGYSDAKKTTSEVIAEVENEFSKAEVTLERTGNLIDVGVYGLNTDSDVQYQKLMKYEELKNILVVNNENDIITYGILTGCSSEKNVSSEETEDYVEAETKINGWRMLRQSLGDLVLLDENEYACKLNGRTIAGEQYFEDIDSLIEKVEERAAIVPIKRLIIGDHGYDIEEAKYLHKSSNGIELGSDFVTDLNVSVVSEKLGVIEGKIADDGYMILLNCYAGSEDNLNIIKSIAKEVKVPIIVGTEKYNVLQNQNEGWYRIVFSDGKVIDMIKPPNGIQDKKGGRSYPYYKKASQKDWKYDSE